MSAANSDLYIGSRTLYGLAVEGKAPAIFKKVTSRGVPLPALILCTLFCSLVFLNVAASGAKGKPRPILVYDLRNSTILSLVFGWFVNLVSTFGALTWMAILYSHM